MEYITILISLCVGLIIINIFFIFLFKKYFNLAAQKKAEYSQLQTLINSEKTELEKIIQLKKVQETARRCELDKLDSDIS